LFSYHTGALRVWQIARSGSALPGHGQENEMLCWVKTGLFVNLIRQIKIA
jgi:hypothetical protein